MRRDGRVGRVGGIAENKFAVDFVGNDEDPVLIGQCRQKREFRGCPNASCRVVRIAEHVGFDAGLGKSAFERGPVEPPGVAFGFQGTLDDVAAVVADGGEKAV